MRSTLLDYGNTPDLDVQSFNEYHIQQIPLSLFKTFMESYHYSGGCGNAVMPWGLYHDPSGQLVGAIGFQTPASENARCMIFEDKPYNEPDPEGGPDDERVHSQNVCECEYIDERHGYREHVTELHRLAIVDEAPQNTASWFIVRALKRLKAYKSKYWAVISMADSTEGHDGTVYQACSADYYGMSRKRTCYVDENGRLRTRRQCGENITVEEARERGWKVVMREQKHRYVFWTPDPYDSKDDLRELAKIELQAYPSRENQ